MGSTLLHRCQQPLSCSFASTSHTPNRPPIGSSERLPAQTDPCRAWQARGVQQAQRDANAHGSCFFTAVSSPVPAKMLFTLPIIRQKARWALSIAVKTQSQARYMQEFVRETPAVEVAPPGPVVNRCAAGGRARAASDPTAIRCHTVGPAGRCLRLGGGQGHVVREEGGVVVVLSTCRGGQGGAGWAAEESAGRAALLLRPGQRHPAHAPRG